MATMKLREPRLASRMIAGVTAILVTSALAACTSSASTGSESGTPHGTIHIVTGSADGMNSGFAAVDAAFEKKFPGTNVVFDPIPNNEYPAAESSRLTAGSADIVMIPAPLNFPSYAKGSESSDTRLAEAGEFIDLTNNPLLRNFTPSLVKATALNGKNFTMPLGLDYVTGVFYNKDLFNKYGLTVPTTWSEFTKVADTFKSNGISPLGIGGKDGWPAGLAMLAAAAGEYPTAADKETLAAGLWKQKIKLTDAKPLEVMKKIQAIYGYAEPNFSGVPYSSIPASFASEQFAMTPDGTWDTTTMQAAVGSKFNIGYFPLPTSDLKANNRFLNGKVEGQLAAASSSKNKTTALAYLSFFAQPDNYALFLKSAGFVSGEPKVLSLDFYKTIQPYTSTYEPVWGDVWTANAKAGTAALSPFNYTAIAPMGTDSADKAAEAAQQAWSAGF